MTGRHAAPRGRRRPASDIAGHLGTEIGPTAAVRAVTADRVTFTGGGRTIVDGVSVFARPGGSLAVVGPSGSGKSSLLALLAGLQAPDSGTVAGHDQRLGLVLQGYGLVSVLTAAENVEIAVQAAVPRPLSPGEITRRSADMLRAVGLDHVSENVIEELSGGQQQRVAIARALAVHPDVVLADEPSAELDTDWKNRIVELVLDVARRGGVVVIATHDLDLAARCDTVIRLVDGRVADH